MRDTSGGGGDSGSSWRSVFVGGHPASSPALRPQEGARAEAGSAMPREAAENMELGEEGQPVRKVRAPRTPSAAEVLEHEDQGHAVYRSWCAVCSGARGTGTVHAARREVEEDRDPVVALDYAYLTKDGREVDASGREAETHDILTL